jgi:hypothetical protein
LHMAPKTIEQPSNSGPCQQTDPDRVPLLQVR